MSRRLQYQRLPFVLLLILCAVSGAARPTLAEGHSVLILAGPDTEQGLLAGTLYRTVAERIADHLEKAGFEALQNGPSKEGAPPIDGGADDQALLDQVRQSPYLNADYVTALTIIADMALVEEGTHIQVRIKGRMLRVKTGDVLARFDLPVPNDLLAPPSCNIRCLAGFLEDNTAALADGLGQVLAERLTRQK
ncbi:hypothetical protein [Sneathiella chinensis]|uniref:FlgO domain-containing protein n=1 Tax=Sneathiella chinensis TaxID=349750 RepID=A0ABQ5U212_9PROT|nr:hypothetical protein [Sneathiella chinensis]GLQ06210.1 hypothetical protein GCM10007924_14310 [Sneathiella chinensis]